MTDDLTDDERRAAVGALRYAAHQLYYGWGDPLARKDPPVGSAAHIIGMKSVTVGAVLSRLADEIQADERDNIYGTLNSWLASAKALELMDSCLHDGPMTVDPDGFRNCARCDRALGRAGD